MSGMKVKVIGMSCNHCKINVETGLKKIAGVETALADIVNGEVTIKGENVNPDNIRSAIESLGYIYDGELR